MASLNTKKKAWRIVELTVAGLGLVAIGVFPLALKVALLAGAFWTIYKTHLQTKKLEGELASVNARVETAQKNKVIWEGLNEKIQDPLIFQSYLNSNYLYSGATNIERGKAFLKDLEQFASGQGQ